jgi:transposase-like protein
MPLSRTVAPYARPPPTGRAAKASDSTDTRFFIPVNNPIEADHSQLKHRLRPMRGLQTDRTALVVIAGHGFMQNLRRGHYELGIEAPSGTRVAAVFTELARAI